MKVLSIALSATLSTIMLFTGINIASTQQVQAIGTNATIVDINKPTIDMETMSVGKNIYYIVKTEDQLRAIGKGKYLMSYNYILDSDISLTREWAAIGDDETPFTGSFNGNGFSISNLKITNKKAKYVGLFGYVEGVTIYNVTLKNVDINSAGGKGKRVGSVVALCLDGKVYDNVVLK